MTGRGGVIEEDLPPQRGLQRPDLVVAPPLDDGLNGEVQQLDVAEEVEAERRRDVVDRPAGIPPGLLVRVDQQAAAGRTYPEEQEGHAGHDPGAKNRPQAGMDGAQQPTQGFLSGTVRRKIALRKPDVTLR